MNSHGLGKIHAYVGTGKGKTTAAVGLLVRCAGYEKSCAMVQFLKGQQTGELHLCKKIENITIEQFGSTDFYRPGISDLLSFRSLCRDALDCATQLLSQSKLLVLDEVLDAVSLELVTEDELLLLLKDRGECEVVLTGRSVPPLIDKECDLITEMKNIRHYYDNGVAAREGVEF